MPWQSKPYALFAQMRSEAEHTRREASQTRQNRHQSEMSRCSLPDQTTMLPLLDVAVLLSCADQAECLPAGGSSEQTWHTGRHQQLGLPQSVPGT